MARVKVNLCIDGADRNEVTAVARECKGEFISVERNSLYYAFKMDYTARLFANRVNRRMINLNAIVFACTN